MRRFSPKRLYRDVYDNSRQGQFSYWNEVELRQTYLAALRLDALLFERVVILDSDLFYGAYFLSIEPAELPLGQIAVRARAPTLEESFLGAVAPRDREFCLPCHFEALPPDQARALHDGLKTYPTASVRSWRDVAALFRSFGVEDRYVDALECGWSRWIDVTCRRPTMLEQWKADFSFQNQCDRHFAELRPGIERSCKSAAAQDALALIDAKRSSRNDVLSGLSGLRAQTQDREELCDIWTCCSGFQEAYSLARAEHQECHMLEVQDAPGTHAFTKERRKVDLCEEVGEGEIMRRKRKASALVPPQLIRPLGLISADQFERVRAKAIEPLGDWHRTGNFGRLERGLDLAAAEVDRVIRIDDPNPLFAQMDRALKPVFSIARVLTDVFSNDVLGFIASVAIKATERMFGEVLGPVGKTQQLSRTISRILRRAIRT